jgi:hypothetical protein
MQNQKEKRKKNMIKGEIALVKLITTTVITFAKSEHWVSLTFSSDSPSPFPNASLWKDAYRIWTSIAGRSAAGWMNDVFLKGCFELWDKEVEEKNGKQF